MRTQSEPTPVLLDQDQERATLDGLLGDLRSGRGRTLVVRAEAGVGKPALLDYVIDAATDMRVARVAGAESEMELAFAGLHPLCAPLLDRLESLPGPSATRWQSRSGCWRGRAGPVPGQAGGPDPVDGGGGGAAVAVRGR
jgi:hypothetical protein